MKCEINKHAHGTSPVLESIFFFFFVYVCFEGRERSWFDWLSVKPAPTPPADNVFLLLAKSSPCSSQFSRLCQGCIPKTVGHTHVCLHCERSWGGGGFCLFPKKLWIFQMIKKHVSVSYKDSLAIFVVWSARWQKMVTNSAELEAAPMCKYESECVCLCVSPVMD